MKNPKEKPFFLHYWGRIGLIMALPGLFFVLIFTVAPFLMNVGYAFTDYNLTSTVPRFTGLTNFKNMLMDRDFFLVLGNTIKVTFTYTVIINVLSIALAVLISKVSRRFGSIVRTAVYFPQMLSIVVVGFLWRIMLNYNYGPVNQLLMLLGVPKGSVPHWLGNPSLIIPSLSIAVIWVVTGYYTTIYYAGIMNIPSEYYEVSMIEGASGLQELFHITLPFLAPSITISTVLLTVESLAVFALPAAMTDGGGPGRYGTTLALWAYNNYYGTHQYGKAIAISVLLGMLAVVISLIELRVLLRREENK